MRQLLGSYNLHSPRRLVYVGAIILFITSVNTMKNVDQESTETNPEIFQYWRIPGHREPFYINFEKEIIQENPRNRIPFINRMSTFTGEKIQYPRTLVDKLDLFRYQFQPQEHVTPTTIEVGKANMLDDSYEIFRKPESTEKLKALEKIIVTDEATGIAEEYILKEWILELTGRMLHPDNEFFTSSKKDGVTLVINEKSQLVNYYKFFGKLFGAAVYHNLFLSASFSNRFYKMMLGKEIELEDIEEVDCSAYNSLKRSKEDKSRSAIEIKSVVQKNHVKPVEAIMFAISNGFDQVVPVRFLKIFKVTELKLVLEGDANIKGQTRYTWLERKLEWRGNIVCPYNEETDSVIRLFWEMLDEFGDYQIRKLLQLVTGMSRLPVGGFARLTPQFHIKRYNSKSCMPPKASIRFNIITLYNCDKDNMRKLILEAVENVDLDKGVSNKELYGVLPTGWQRWQWKEPEDEEIDVYLNLDTKKVQRKDPRLGTSIEPLYMNEKETYTQSLEQRIRLFRYQLYIANNVAYPGGFVMEKTQISNIVEKSYEYIMNIESITRLHPTFFVYLKDNNGHQGCTVQVQEWLTTLFQKVFDPINKFFKYVDREDHRLRINTHFRKLSYFKFIGRLLGLSIIHDVPIAAYFNKPFYRLMLGERTSLEDIKDFDLQYYNTLSNPKKSDQSFESKDGTTLQNKDEVIDESIREKYLIPILPQMSAILSGLDDFVHPYLLKIFNVDELKQYLGGTSVIDVQDWRENTRYIGFTKDSDTVKFLWEIVEKFEEDDMERLLRFATGRLRIRPPGFKNLSPMFTIKLRDEEEERGITFDVKYSKITLPKYSSRGDLENDLKAALAVPLPFENR